MKIFTGDSAITVIGLVADTRNSSVEKPLLMSLGAATRSDNSPQVQGWVINHNELHGSLAQKDGRDSVRRILRNGHNKLSVAMIGVNGTSSYEAEIHSFLDAWKSSSKRPVVLIAASNPAEAKRAVDSWKGWNQVEDLREAILVNKEYLVGLSGEKALAELKAGVDIADKLGDKLGRLVDTKPSPVVAEPSIVPFPKTKFHSGAA